MMRPEAIISGIPGVRPINQERSWRAVAKLIEVSEPLMRKQIFDDIGVEDFALASGLSNGAFYSRFESKDAFFDTIVAIRTAELVEASREISPSLSDPSMTLEECTRELVALIVEFTRTNRGMIASAVRRSRDRVKWQPHRMAGRAVIETARPMIPKLGGNDTEKEDNFYFGFQVLYGVTANAAVNDPGPILLDDDRIIDHLVKVLLKFWQ
jgi:AcrR family transcriptional regulator